MLLSKLSTLFAKVHHGLSCLCICFLVKLTMLLDFSYIKGLLGGPTPAEYDALKQEKENLKQQLESTKKQLEDLQAKVCHRKWHCATTAYTIYGIHLHLLCLCSAENKMECRVLQVMQQHQALRQLAKHSRELHVYCSKRKGVSLMDSDSDGQQGQQYG